MTCLKSIVRSMNSSKNKLNSKINYIFNLESNAHRKQPILKRECTKNNSIINNKTLKFDNQ